MKATKRVLSVLIAAIMMVSMGVIAFADGDYSVTWVYENRTEVDWYDAGETIVVRTPLLEDGRIGLWAEQPNKTITDFFYKSPVPEKMPNENLIFFVAVNATGMSVIKAAIQGYKEMLTKEYWQAKYPLFWIFPYTAVHIIVFFNSIFN